MQDLVISKESLTNELNCLLKEINCKNVKLLSPIFREMSAKISDLLLNVFKNQTNDIAIFYGIDHSLTQHLIKDALSSLLKTAKKFHFKFVNLNSYIYAGDDNIKKKICDDLGIKTKNSTSIEQLEKLFQELSIQDNLDKPSIYVVYFENIEILFQKQKQNLFYTILELVNKSKNLFFAGTTRNFNIMDSMEKRVRSRYIQRSLNMSSPEFEKIISSLRYLVSKKVKNKKTPKIISKAKSSIEITYECITESKSFAKYFQKVWEMGSGISDIFHKLRQLFSEFLFHLKAEKKILIDTKSIENFCDNYFEKIAEKSNTISNLENISKFNTVCLAALLKCTKKNLERITANLVYGEYMDYINYTTIKSVDIILVKKSLQELAEFGFISINFDQKYCQTYEFKFPPEEILQCLKNERFSKDKNLSLWLFDKKEK